MLRSQLILIAAGVLVLASLLVFGTTVAPKETTLLPAMPVSQVQSGFDIDHYIDSLSGNLSLRKRDHLDSLKERLETGIDAGEKDRIFDSLSIFWLTDARDDLVANYY